MKDWKFKDFSTSDQDGRAKPPHRRFGLTYLPVAKMPIVVMTHKGVGVKNLTTQQICDIYSGKSTDREKSEEY